VGALSALTAVMINQSRAKQRIGLAQRDRSVAATPRIAWSSQRSNTAQRSLSHTQSDSSSLGAGELREFTQSNETHAETFTMCVASLEAETLGGIRGLCFVSMYTRRSGVDSKEKYKL
jgi:hypothetical protein